MLLRKEQLYDRRIYKKIKKNRIGESMKKINWQEKITTICLFVMLLSCVAILGLVIVFGILTFSNFFL